MKIFFSYIFVASLILSGFFIAGCDNKLDLSQFPISTGTTPVVSDTTYVQQYPVWGNFNQPEDVIIGREPMVYVADTKSNSVVQMDLSGLIVSAYQFKSPNVANPRKLAQDINFDLLVICDSALSATDTVSVIYRFRLFDNGGILTNITPIRFISSLEGTVTSSNKRKFTAVSVFQDNSLLVSRTGPTNSGTPDPDNALLRMYGRNTVTNVTSYNGFQTTGNGVFSIEKVSGLATINNSNSDFVLTRNGNVNGILQVLWFYLDQATGGYEPKFLPTDNVDLLNKSFGGPASIAMDNSNSIYIIDAVKDSLYRFSSTGMSLPGSFGGNGSGVNKFNHPKGIAYFNKTIYVADTYNNRIVRFKLSTDLN